MPKLYLIPTPLSDQCSVLIDARLEALKVFVVEDPKTARHALKKIIPSIQLAACEFFVLNEHTNQKSFDELTKQLGDRDVGLLSDAGMPCIADPGHLLVRFAHAQGRTVVPLVGPNAMMLALAASGLSGQQFAFNGYLPREHQERIVAIKTFEKESLTKQRAQIFIEAPHHNRSLFVDFIDHLRTTTALTIAADITGLNELIQTYPVSQWRQRPIPTIDKIPTVFIIQAEA